MIFLMPKCIIFYSFSFFTQLQNLLRQKTWCSFYLIVKDYDFEGKSETVVWHTDPVATVEN